MFPTIISLALRDAGTKTKLASSLLIMTIMDGAVALIIIGFFENLPSIVFTTLSVPLAGDRNLPNR